MKKEYTKPILDIKAYAQFENVFTACSKVKNDTTCSWIPGNPGDQTDPNFKSAHVSFNGS